MPRCLRLELADVAAWPNLEAALWLAARGKRARPDVAEFLHQAPAFLQQVQTALLAGRMPQGTWRSFTIQDPKPRIIHAAPFADRIAHHALMRLMEPRLEQALVDSSFAYRPGRGVHAAIHQAQAHMLAKPSAWVLKLDVWHCFAQMPHAVVRGLLQRRFKGSALGVVDAVLASHERMAGSQRGLPIGALTSQHFANQVLGEIDREALAQAACLAHVRYMDDVLLWVPSRAAGLALAAHLQAWLRECLGLQFKPPELLPVRAGVAFCGMRLGPQGLRPSRRRLRAWASRCRALVRAVEHSEISEISEAAAQAQAETLRALCLPAKPVAWQRGVLKTLGQGACV